MLFNHSIHNGSREIICLLFWTACLSTIYWTRHSVSCINHLDLKLGSVRPSSQQDNWFYDTIELGTRKPQILDPLPFIKGISRLILYKTEKTGLPETMMRIETTISSCWRDPSHLGLPRIDTRLFWITDFR